LVREKDVMLFSYEQLIRGGYENLIDCSDVNQSGIRRFSPCPMTTRIMWHSGQDKFLNIDLSSCKWIEASAVDDRYIISTGVNHSPSDWCGFPEHQTRKNAFEWLSEKYISDLKSGKALILFDQSHEGYQTPWLWDWFHYSVTKYDIPAESIIYVTGNIDAADQYRDWCSNRNIRNKIKVIPYIHFEHMIFHRAINIVRFEGKSSLPTVEEHIAYKTQHDIKDYNFLQKRLRSHRAWGFKAFHDAGILDSGLVSMNSFNYLQTHMEGKSITEEETELLNKSLPLEVYGKGNNIHDDLYYITRFNEDVMLDSWISVVSEASFSDVETTCFLSEKIFKPIAANHPFIVFGNKHSLKRLREMGYKTFHPYIDETYDELSTWDRLDAIIKSIQQFQTIENKVEWYKSISHILDHNREVLRRNSMDYMPDAILELEKYYKVYFNVC